MLQFLSYQISPIEEKDAADFFRLIDENRSRLRRFFPLTSKVCKDFFSTQKYLAAKILEREAKKFYFFKITEKGTSGILGCLILKSIDWRIPKGELAYFIDKNQEGKGIISGAIAKLSRYCFEEMDFKKLFLRIAEANIGSRRIAEKNGFVLEGKLRYDFRIETGKLIDVLYYGKVRN